MASPSQKRISMSSHVMFWFDEGRAMETFRKTRVGPARGGGARKGSYKCSSEVSPCTRCESPNIGGKRFFAGYNDTPCLKNTPVLLPIAGGTK